MEIGIDLGTSNSLITYWNAETQMPELIPNQFGDFLTPSVVNVTASDEIIVGKLAKLKQTFEPERTASQFKLFMGLEKNYSLGNKNFTPIELSALILKSLKADAERFLNETISDVVISVPAYFNSFQREATIAAGQLAGLNVRQLISEPTCASLYYGIENQHQDTTFLVLDLGGGTFDVSVISLFENIIQVEAVAGNNHLGGELINQMILDHLIGEHGETVESWQIMTETTSLNVLDSKIEQLKRKFSDSFTLSAAFDYQYKAESKTYMLTAVDFRELLMPFLAKLMPPIKRALREAAIPTMVDYHTGKTYYNLDQIVLVGGATKLLVIQEAFAKIVGLTPTKPLNPDQAVAFGAAIRAHMLNDTARNELIMTDVIGFSLGTEVIVYDEKGNPTKNTKFDPIIERNTSIPVSITKSYYKIHQSQKEIEFRFFQGESINVNENLLIGTLNFPVKHLTISEPILVNFSYDESGVLAITINDEKLLQTKELIIQNRHVKLNSNELKKVLNKLADIKMSQFDNPAYELMKNRLMQVYEAFIGDDRKLIADTIARLDNLITNEHRPKQLRIGLSEIQKLINYYEENL